jgi:predicted permease
MLRFPHIYAIVLSLAFNVAEFRVAPVFQRPIELVGDTAVPLMLIALGLRLCSVRISSWRRPMLVTLVRLAGGYATGLIFVTVFQLQGDARGCLLLASVMPAAVVTFVFAEKYGRDGGDVAATVALSTVVSTVTTPLLLAYGL